MPTSSVPRVDLPAVAAQGLTKTYRDTPVLAGLDLAVPTGSVFALLGPNGAGKTTTVRILATLTGADAGHARVAGFDVATDRREVRRRISLTGQYAAVDDGQTGRENLVMLARLAGRSRRHAHRRADELLELFDLAPDAGRPVGTYSGGMRRRLDLAAGLVADPEVVFLDEPTTGLDPRSRRDTWAMVRTLTSRGTTVFLTTQYLEEADRLADRIALLDNGRIIAEGTANELKRRVGEHVLHLLATDAAALTGMATRLGGQAVRIDPQGLTIDVATDGSATHVRDLLDRADPERTALSAFEVRAASLDDVFLTLTGLRSPTTAPPDPQHGRHQRHDSLREPQHPATEEPTHA